MTEGAKLIVEVTAGLIPGQPEPEFTRRWAITSSEWAKAQQADEREGEAWHKLHVAQLLEERAAVADAYARLLRNPTRFNFVRVDWIWL